MSYRGKESILLKTMKILTPLLLGFCRSSSALPAGVTIITEQTFDSMVCNFIFF